MKILVCITHVPDTTSKINFKDNNTKFDSTGVQYIIGPYDDYALARAVELKEATGSTVTVLNVGLAETEPTIRKALAIGADDAIRVNAEPLDSMFVATNIAEQAKAGLEGAFIQSVREHRTAAEVVIKEQGRPPLKPLTEEDYPRLAVDSGSQGEMNTRRYSTGAYYSGITRIGTVTGRRGTLTFLIFRA